MKKLLQFFKEELWKPIDATASNVKRVWLQSLRFIWRTISKFQSSHCELHAASLTYFTLLTFVPILCLVLLLAKTCGMGEAVRDKLNVHFNEVVEKARSDFLQGVEAEKYLQEKEPKCEKSKLNEAENGQYAQEVSQEGTVKTKDAQLEDKVAFVSQIQHIANGLFDRIDKFDISKLGWIGLVILVWSVVSTLGKVEISFNEIWDVAKPRSIFRKFILYVIVAVILPSLLLAAASMPILSLVRRCLEFLAIPGTGAFLNILDSLLSSGIFSSCLTFVFTSLAMAFFLSFMPHAKVRIKYALIGGVITSLLLLGWLKLCTILSIGIASYSAIYGSFAFLPIVLAWVYMSWQIILFGACVLRAMHLKGTDRK